MAHTRGRRRRTAGAPAAAAAVVLALAPPAQAVPARGPVQGAATAVEGGYIVALKRGPGAPSASSGRGRETVERYGVSIRRTYRTALDGYAIRADETQARRLAADPAVASVTRDARVSLRSAAAPRRSPRTQPYPPSWGLDRIDQPDPVPDGAPERTLDGAYTAPADGGRGVTVYVVDSGVRTGHRDFGGRARSGWDFVDDDPVAEDGNGHGTHVAATAAGTRYGVAKRADVVAVRVLDDRGQGTSAQVLAGLDWVLKHAVRPAVVNLSLGTTDPAPVPAWDTAVRTGIASGLTFTVAAGNEGLSAGSSSPGRVREAITVGATDRFDRRPRFSNWGPAVDLFAPGDRIVSASHTSDTAAATRSGTSMAAPHAAGAAALYLAAHRSASPARVSAALTAAAATGAVRGAGRGSPNRLLRVAN
ncbi:S8 family peptidase [Streptomyces sp. NA02950]|uniref:S8 family peptidase n=1 Tax=Streptomyces sp. NA02950 TaxID=2742137 RepID=UPI0015906C00|nr:S8 family peptidase [Streptomyces sp. NA02950]QKV92473.1 S8 family peptidase [Streptomyces sp. NA02950]